MQAHRFKAILEVIIAAQIGTAALPDILEKCRFIKISALLDVFFLKIRADDVYVAIEQFGEIGSCKTFGVGNNLQHMFEIFTMVGDY